MSASAAMAPGVTLVSKLWAQQYYNALPIQECSAYPRMSWDQFKTYGAAGISYNHASLIFVFEQEETTRLHAASAFHCSDMEQPTPKAQP